MKIFSEIQGFASMQLRDTGFDLSDPDGAPEDGRPG